MEPQPNELKAGDNGDTDTTRMEGFGSETLMTPFYYGSVADGSGHRSTLEQKLRKKYWKTKQTVIQKLGKSQDEFVIAGDADIDSKLEKAYHLRSSCQDLLLALERCALKTRVLSSDEMGMGDYLTCTSESEYTNAGEVMHKVGKVLQKDSLGRMDTLSPMTRLQQEFGTFKGSAITDLDHSISTLEKSRTEYRAALLWMKNVSEKLQDPDYRDQLAKFREAQAAVKETKHHFEKLKVDLSEKIDMVSASRCNLLSHVLPGYQKHVLDYLDASALEFHQVMADLQANQHHHQYRVTRVMKEIRELELEEDEDLEDHPLDGEGEEGGKGEREEDDDVPLIDVGGAPTPDAGKGEVKTETEEDEADVRDLDITGVGADLQELLELDQPPNASDELDDLLGLGPQADGGAQPLTTASNNATETTDQLIDAWNDFSAFMSADKPDAGLQGSDWQQELMREAQLEVGGGPTSLSSQVQGGGGGASLVPVESPSVNKDSVHVSKPPTGTGERDSSGVTQPPQASEVDMLLGLSGDQPPPKSAETSTSLSDDILALTLEDSLQLSGKNDTNGVVPTSDSTGVIGSGLETLNPTLFQLQSTMPFPHPTATTPAIQPSLSTYPTSYAAHGTTLNYPFRPPLAASHGPVMAPRAPSAPGAGVASGVPAQRPGALSGGGRESEKGEKNEGKKGSSWMNFFAHLDPLVNEKV